MDMSVLLGLLPVVGVALFFFLKGRNFSSMFDFLKRGKKHDKVMEDKIEEVKKLEKKEIIAVTKIKDAEKLTTESRVKIEKVIVESQQKVKEIMESENKISDLATRFDQNW